MNDSLKTAAVCLCAENQESTSNPNRQNVEPWQPEAWQQLLAPDAGGKNAGDSKIPASGELTRQIGDDPFLRRHQIRTVFDPEAQQHRKSPFLTQFMGGKFHQSGARVLLVILERWICDSEGDRSSGTDTYRQHRSYWKPLRRGSRGHRRIAGTCW